MKIKFYKNISKEHKLIDDKKIFTILVIKYLIYSYIKFIDAFIKTKI